MSALWEMKEQCEINKWKLLSRPEKQTKRQIDEKKNVFRLAVFCPFTPLS
jgi:hypothetical protein